MDPGRLRIGLVGEPVAPDIAVDPEVAAALADAARLCEALGHDVVPTAWPALPARPATVMSVISSAGTAAAIDDRLADLGRPAHDDELDGWLQSIVEQGRRATAVDYVRAVSTMHAIGRAVGSWMTDFDVVLTPTLAVLPPPIGVLDPRRPILDVIGLLGALTGFLSIFNATGQPAMSVPLGRSASGLPIGVQFAGRFGDESTLFRLAGQLERARPWPGLAPAVA